MAETRRGVYARLELQPLTFVGSDTFATVSTPSSESDHVFTDADGVALVLKIGLGLLPGGGAISAVVEEVQRVRRERVTALGTHVLSLADQAAVVRRLHEDEAFAELFTMALEAAMRTRAEVKRRAIGRALAHIVATGDDAEVCLDSFAVRAFATLDVAHFRALQDLDRRCAELGPEMAGVARDVMVAPVRSALLNVGAIDENAGFDGDFLRINEFGSLLLERLNEPPAP